MSLKVIGNTAVQGTGGASGPGNYFCPSCGCTMPGVHWAGCMALNPPMGGTLVDIRIAEALERIAKALEERPI